MVRPNSKSQVCVSVDEEGFMKYSKTNVGKARKDARRNFTLFSFRAAHGVLMIDDKVSTINNTLNH